MHWLQGSQVRQFELVNLTIAKSSRRGINARWAKTLEVTKDRHIRHSPVFRITTITLSTVNRISFLYIQHCLSKKALSSLWEMESLSLCKFLRQLLSLQIFSSPSINMQWHLKSNQPCNSLAGCKISCLATVFIHQKHSNQIQSKSSLSLRPHLAILLRWTRSRMLLRSLKLSKRSASYCSEDQAKKTLSHTQRRRRRTLMTCSKDVQTKYQRRWPWQSKMETANISTNVRANSLTNINSVQRRRYRNALQLST